METVATFIAILLALAFLTESMVEFIFSPFVGFKRAVPYVALVVGVAVAIIYRLDALQVFFGLSTPVPYAGYVLTGLMLGRGSSFLHDFYKTYVQPAPTQ